MQRIAAVGWCCSSLNAAKRCCCWTLKTLNADLNAAKRCCQSSAKVWNRSESLLVNYETQWFRFRHLWVLRKGPVKHAANRCWKHRAYYQRCSCLQRSAAKNVRFSPCLRKSVTRWQNIAFSGKHPSQNTTKFCEFGGFWVFLHLPHFGVPKYQFLALFPRKFAFSDSKVQENLRREAANYFKFQTCYRQPRNLKELP